MLILTEEGEALTGLFRLTIFRNGDIDDSGTLRILTFLFPLSNRMN